MPDIKVYDILVSPLSPEHIYLATGLGVYVSKNRGENWESCNNNLPLIEVSDIDFSPGDSTIRVSTMGRGIWKTDALLPEPTNTNELENWAAEIDFIIFPNPANSFVNLTFNLKNNGLVKMAILDELGQVLQKEKQYLNAGKQQFQMQLNGWNGKGLPSGVYFIRLEMEGKRLHKKVVKK